MRSQELKRAKRRVRAAVLAARDAVPPSERQRLGERITERFVAVPEFEAAGTVLLFWSFGSEVPTQPLLSAFHGRGVVTALPKVRGDELEVRTYVPGDALTPTAFGALEPAAGALVAPEDLDLLCIPGVAFDLQGRRVGYGGGFYDRFLLLTRPDALRAAVAFEVQIVDGALPAGPFDRPVDLVVTETRILRVVGADPET